MRSCKVRLVSCFLCALFLACSGSPPTSPSAADGGVTSGADVGASAKDVAKDIAVVRRDVAASSQGGAQADGAGSTSTGGIGGSVGPDASKDWAPPAVSPGSMVDPRDGTEYKTVTINGLTWMAENLRYLPSATAIKDGLVRCGKSTTFDYCATYGSYYSTSITADPCPTGWRMPTAEQFTALFEAHSLDPLEAATKLRDTSWNGTNDYGFSVLPAGYYDSSWGVSDIRHARVPGEVDYALDAGFLTSTTKSSGYSYRTVAWIYPDSGAGSTTGVELFDDNTNSLTRAFNVRCVK